VSSVSYGESDSDAEVLELKSSSESVSTDTGEEAPEPTGKKDGDWYSTGEEGLLRRPDRGRSIGDADLIRELLRSGSSSKSSSFSELFSPTSGIDNTTPGL
jgi:hypothetical protein